MSNKIKYKKRKKYNNSMQVMSKIFSEGKKRRKVRKTRRMRPVKRKKSKIGIYLTAFLLVAAVMIGANWWSGKLKPVADSGQTQTFVLESGMTASQVAQELQQKNLIRSAEAFRALARKNNADAKLMAGMYSLSPQMSAQEILDTLLKGPIPDIVKVTIPEGYSVAEIVQTLSQKGLGTEAELYKVMRSYSVRDYAFLKDIPKGDNPLEGFLFPDTYFFDKDAKPKEVIDRFLVRFEKELTEETQARLEELDISVYTWVTKASVVEKEAAKETERPLIAGVFNNRLKTGMPLQSCATVQYVLGEVKPILSLEDIEIDSPYNTYKNTGLPPGPIANPGHASLTAVLYPTKTDYYYFVAKNDGSHAFAVTYDEHLRNVNRYQ